MKKRGRSSLLIAASSIIICVLSLLVVGTVALFTDEVTYTTHLQAGTLDVTLKRTSGTKTVLSDNGELTSETLGEENFTDPTNDNIFGIEENEYIVPGSVYEAVLEIAHASGSNIAFTYSVEFQVKDTNNGDVKIDTDLAENLNITIYTLNGTTKENIKTKTLKEIYDATTTHSLDLELENAKVLVGESGSKFGIKVEFNSEAGNEAQSKQVIFDVIVRATQYVPSSN